MSCLNPLTRILWATRWTRMFVVLLLATTAAGAELRVIPEQVELTDSHARRQLVVLFDGRDMTAEATFTSANEQIARIAEGGYVVPIVDGQTSIAIIAGGTTKSIPVIVRGCATRRPVDFGQEIEPLLTRYSCNSGGCHGKASGQNGFKLSLFGFDTAADFDEIVRKAHGRRVSIAAPQKSLLLQKAIGLVPHGGGKRFEVGSEPYQVLLDWIATGAKQQSADAPALIKLHVEPSQAVLKAGYLRQVVVMAEYGNGERRDVTRQASFASNFDLVATVNENGRVTCGQLTGEAAIMASYRGQVAVTQIIVPHTGTESAPSDFKPINYVDELALAKWKQLDLAPSPICDDATFLRRATLDICGRLPTSDEVRAFAADGSPEKRTKLVERLLDSPDYAAFFALRWSSILRNSKLAGADQASYAFHNWIKDMLARNRPYDEFVRGIVAAAGEWQDSPAVNWYWQNRDDQLHQTTADVAQIFLGTRLQCAKCHHHPYERWSQEDYYGLAGFFTRLGRKSFGEPPPYFASATVTTGEQNPLTRKTPEPKYLDGAYAKFGPEEDPRHALVDWMAKPDNPLFAKALVNRLWGHCFGRGLVQEVDDLRQTNPPSNGPLLDALAKDFIDHKFDQKHILRVMLTSRIYQLSSAPTPNNQRDTQNFARYYGRRLIAEVLLDAVDQACGTKSNFGGVAASARAVDLPNEGFGSYFLDTFDRPRRVTACECERSSGATLSQVLLLSNSDEMENKLADGNGKIAKLLAAKKPIPEMVDELFAGSISRLPTPRERELVLKTITQAKDQRQGLEDVLWSLLNTKEFLFNH